MGRKFRKYAQPYLSLEPGFAGLKPEIGKLL
jgi:hypothetical protein